MPAPSAGFGRSDPYNGADPTSEGELARVFDDYADKLDRNDIDLKLRDAVRRIIDLDDALTEVISEITGPGSPFYDAMDKYFVHEGELSYRITDFGARQGSSSDPDINRTAIQTAVDFACANTSEGQEGSNLLRNPGFELAGGTALGWPGATNNHITTEYAHSGTHSWRKPADSYRENTSHPIAALPGHTYRVSFWQRTPGMSGHLEGSNIAGATFQLQQRTEENDSFHQAAAVSFVYNEEWTQYTFEYTTPLDIIDLRIRYYSNAQITVPLFVDDIDIHLIDISNPGRAKTVVVPGSSATNHAYQVMGQINVPNVITIVGNGARPWMTFNQGVDTGEYGFSFDDGAELGASPQEWFRMENLAFKGGSAGTIRCRGIATFRLRRLFWHLPNGPAIHLEYCQDFAVEDVDVYFPNGGGGKNCYTNGRPELAVLYIHNCNNVYFDLFRCERPESIVAYITNSSGTFSRGKVDSNVNGITDDPCFYFRESQFGLNNIGLRGLKSTPIVCDNFVGLNFNTGAGGNFEGAVIKLINQNVGYNPSNYFRGTMRSSTINIDGGVNGESSNTVWNVTSLIDYVAPDPIITSAGDLDWAGEQVRITERFSNGYANTNFLRVKLTYTTDGGATWTEFPYGGDYLNGMWLMDMQTGDRTRIIDQQVGSHFMLEEKANSGRFPNTPDEARYRITHPPDDGVTININDLKVAYRTRPDYNVFTPTARIPSNAPGNDFQIVSSVYDGATYTTTITMSDTVPAEVQVGHYLTARDDPSIAFLIRGISGTDVMVDTDVTGKLTENWWDFRAGKVYSGLENIRWEVVNLTRRAHGMNQSD